eukprot:CAMPEP_0178440276 /NCGR_PEP_ID=MMETSP0689_2-20121128/36674_1 /TAXON_ID=160604 /ORGANISM="Amphidinium massartii, Strain CS-259" /LENGTH=170 /DNA_ID=CAMNT_0020063003 /DNA_START=142 /DNA_END=655 /DNA_ORIENTATION=-
MSKRWPLTCTNEANLLDLSLKSRSSGSISLNVHSWLQLSTMLALPASVLENMTRCLLKPASNAPTDSSNFMTSCSLASSAASATAKTSHVAQSSMKDATAAASKPPPSASAFSSVPSRCSDTFIRLRLLEDCPSLPSFGLSDEANDNHKKMAATNAMTVHIRYGAVLLLT